MFVKGQIWFVFGTRFRSWDFLEGRPHLHRELDLLLGRSQTSMKTMITSDGEMLQVGEPRRDGHQEASGLEVGHLALVAFDDKRKVDVQVETEDCLGKRVVTPGLAEIVAELHVAKTE